MTATLINRVGDCNPALIQPKNGFNPVEFLGCNRIGLQSILFNRIEFSIRLNKIGWINRPHYISIILNDSSNCCQRINLVFTMWDDMWSENLLLFPFLSFFSILQWKLALIPFFKLFKLLFTPSERQRVRRSLSHVNTYMSILVT